jgi:hypothetical protein
MVLTPAATGSISISVDTAVYGTAPQVNLELLHRYQRRLYSRVSPQPSDRVIEAFTYTFSATAPPSWLEAVQNAIKASIAEEPNSELIAEGRIRPEVAKGAIDFFERTADLLPSEPYLYPSDGGDLIAEMSSDNARITTIVSSSMVILFGSTKGVAFERRVSDTRSLRAEVQRLMKCVDSAPHGDLETEGR